MNWDELLANNGGFTNTRIYTMEAFPRLLQLSFIKVKVMIVEYPDKKSSHKKTFLGDLFDFHRVYLFPRFHHVAAMQRAFFWVGCTPHRAGRSTGHCFCVRGRRNAGDGPSIVTLQNPYKIISSRNTRQNYNSSNIQESVWTLTKPGMQGWLGHRWSSAFLLPFCKKTSTTIKL